MKKTVLLSVIILIAVLTCCEFGMKELADELTEASYTVTYDANGADSVTENSVPRDLNEYKTGFLLTVLGNTGNLTKSGFYYSGWNTQKDGQGVTYTQGHIFSIGKSNVVLYAKWSNTPVYRILYNANGSESGSVPPDSTYYPNGGQVAIPGNPGNLVKTGYTFTGWNTQSNGQGSNYTQGSIYTMGTATITLYANWTSDAVFGVVYLKNNPNVTGTPPVDSTMYYMNADVVVLMNTGNMQYPGYHFDGWNTKDDGTGTTYNSTIENPVTFKMPEGGEILYAIWNPNNYTVYFNYQDGVTAQTSKTVIYDAQYGILPTPTRTGYTFGGWYTGTGGSGTQIISTTTVNITAIQNLYVRWIANDYTVIFNPNGGTVNPTSKIVTYGSTYDPLPLPTRPNYTFGGWYNSSGNKVLNMSTVTETATHTLTAVWIAN